VQRAEMFAHHHIQREQLSVGERMSDILSALATSGFVPFMQLFRPQEGRMGVTVTFVAILELMREGLIDVVQTQAYAPLHVRAANPGRTLHVVSDEASTVGVAPHAESGPDAPTAAPPPVPTDEDVS
jgi:segregation and condensation protein A